MDPPPFTSAPSPSPSMSAPSPKPTDNESGAPVPPPAGPAPAFSLPYRMIYAVATQDAIHVYDTQQQKPLCIVSNLHFATFTDITWWVLKVSLITSRANTCKGPTMELRCS
jgi:chromatin assembly factor 1 subunit B